MTKTCEICKREFEKPYKYSRSQWENTKLCSTVCRAKSQIGTRRTERQKERISVAHLGQRAWNKGIFGLKYPPRSPETCKRMSEAKKGEKSHFWRGGVTPINRKIRSSAEYRKWRASVLKRDNYSCVECGGTNVPLHADHIKPFAYFVELRFELDNGRALCVPCHQKTETWGNANYSTK
jgi:hypothetical protein